LSAVVGFQRASWSAMNSLDVLAAKLAGEERVAVGLAVGGQQPDGVGVGLDGPGALVLGFQGAAEAAVEGQEVPSRQRTAHGCGLYVRHVSSH
jgi:hypothetical protein